MQYHGIFYIIPNSQVNEERDWLGKTFLEATGDVRDNHGGVLALIAPFVDPSLPEDIP
jgi:hypothetical protein